MKKLILLSSLLVGALSLMAQHTVRGTVVNRKDGSAIEVAAVRLFHYSGKDSTLVQGAQTDLQGVYTLTNIKNGTYRLWVSTLGYKPQRIAVTVQGSDVSLSPIKLEEDIHVLGEVKVQGHAAEMTVKGDTIEFNTAAYKLGENAMVEDLLKKMNGVTVDKEGNVTVNGENIKGIRIDGKKFFGDDVQSATKNIPADMIEKVQVIEEKSDMAKLTGFDDDESEHIINLTLKKDRKKGLFGSDRQRRLVRLWQPRLWRHPLGSHQTFLQR